MTAAAIDYDDMEDQIKAIIEAYSGLQTSDGVTVLVEEDFSQVVGAIDNGKIVIVYLDDRAATPGQPIAAGQRTRMDVGFSIWVAAVSAESFRKAAQLRTDLICKVELALMGNRTLNNRAASSWLLGGEFHSARKKSPTGLIYMAMAEVKLVAEATASTQ